MLTNQAEVFRWVHFRWTIKRCSYSGATFLADSPAKWTANGPNEYLVSCSFYGATFLADSPAKWTTNGPNEFYKTTVAFIEQLFWQILQPSGRKSCLMSIWRE